MVIAAVLAVTGCKTVREATPASRKSEDAKTALVQRQARNLRFADAYVGRLIEAVHDNRELDADPARRYVLSGWLLQQANAAYVDATGESPMVSSLDLVTLANLSSMVAEASAGDRQIAQPARLVAAHRELADASWELVSDVLSPQQQQQLRDLFAEWRKQNPDVVNVPFIRFQNFVRIMRDRTKTNTELMPGGLMGLIGLDPVSSLDPAVRQVEQTRLLAERAIFYAQRVPVIFDLQLDRSLNRLAAGPESRKLLEQTSSLSSSAARFAAVAEALPGTFSAEREALIRQLNDVLNTQAATLQPMLVDLRNALEAGNATATSVDQAARSIDALVARFAKPPGDAARDTGRPFDINDYARAAEEISRAAAELQRLLDSMGTQAPKLDTALDASFSKGQALADYLFVRAAWLIALLCAGLLATLLLYRWLAPRIRPT
jgi:hypothetical protein